MTGDKWQAGAVKGLGSGWGANETTLPGGPSAVLARDQDHALIDQRNRLPTLALPAWGAAELLNGPVCRVDLARVHGQTATTAAACSISSSVAMRSSNSPALMPSANFVNSARL